MIRDAFTTLPPPAFLAFVEFDLVYLRYPQTLWARLIVADICGAPVAISSPSLLNRFFNRLVQPPSRGMSVWISVLPEQWIWVARSAPLRATMLIPALIRNTWILTAPKLNSSSIGHSWKGIDQMKRLQNLRLHTPKEMSVRL
uniref:ARAD1C05896p n=1 Tax=Blastobotrys adeninivorans TaxID=409370 RepID=A0A060SZN2_BLAAD